MTTKTVLLKVASELPEDASVLDAINNIELYAALNDASIDCLQATTPVLTRDPAWIYESPSRLSVVMQNVAKAR
jgi:hypothetical protein